MFIQYIFLLYSDDVSLEGLQEELEECKNDVVSNFFTIIFRILTNIFNKAFWLLNVIDGLMLCDLYDSRTSLHWEWPVCTQDSDVGRYCSWKVRSHKRLYIMTIFAESLLHRMCKKMDDYDW